MVYNLLGYGAKRLIDPRALTEAGGSGVGGDPGAPQGQQSPCPSPSWCHWSPLQALLLEGSTLQIGRYLCVCVYFPPTDLHPDQSEGELFAFVCVLSVSVYVWPLGIHAQSHHRLDLGTCCSLTSVGLPDWALPNSPQCSRRQSQMTQSCQIPLLRGSVKQVFSTSR